MTNELAHLIHEERIREALSPWSTRIDPPFLPARQPWGPALRQTLATMLHRLATSIEPTHATLERV
jgi:hypothetical protein